MSGARVLIVGQGLAGTALGLELEAAGVDFVVATAGHADAASRIAAGLINPITGLRAVKSAHVDELLPEAEVFYRRAGALLGVDLWQPVRFTRRWRDAAERAALVMRLARGDLAPYAGADSAGPDGITVQGAARVDLPALLAGAERRWEAAGRLRRRRVAREEVAVRPAGVWWGGEEFTQLVLCTGAGELARAWFGAEPLAVVAGEILTLADAGLAPEEARNGGGHWVIGGVGGQARVGATYRREGGAEITAAAREKLLAVAHELGVAPAARVVEQVAGRRMTLPDRLPVAGVAAAEPRVGLCCALGSKGALWAPRLARTWRAHVAGGAPFPALTAVGRAGGR
jgi:glycine/D-amino acid oxidase-like deaminating enzyme